MFNRNYRGAVNRPPHVVDFPPSLGRIAPLVSSPRAGPAGPPPSPAPPPPDTVSTGQQSRVNGRWAMVSSWRSAVSGRSRRGAQTG
eukprot:140447-Prorocentrum_minimum.AAC.2